MKVKELMKILIDLDQNLTVNVGICENGTTTTYAQAETVNTVIQNTSGNKFIEIVGDI